MPIIFSISFILLVNLLSFAQVKKVPETKEGEGPYTQLIIRGVTIIDGTGAPTSLSLHFI